MFVTLCEWEREKREENLLECNISLLDRGGKKRKKIRSPLCVIIAYSCIFGMHFIPAHIHINTLSYSTEFFSSVTSLFIIFFPRDYFPDLSHICVAVHMCACYACDTSVRPSLTRPLDFPIRLVPLLLLLLLASCYSPTLTPVSPHQSSWCVWLFFFFCSLIKGYPHGLFLSSL